MVQLVAKKRSIVGKKVRHLRGEGILPAVVYGAGKASEHLSLNTTEFEKVWKSAGESTLIDLAIEGSVPKNVLIHDVAIDPRKDIPLHVDFLEVSADKKITARIPLVFVGESDAVKTLGGVLVKLLHEVEIEAFPKDLPHEIEVDISSITTFEDHILLHNIAAPSGVEFLGDRDIAVAKVEPPRAEEAAPLAETAEVDLSAIEVEKKGKKEEPGEADESGE